VDLLCHDGIESCLIEGFFGGEYEFDGAGGHLGLFRK
jgi:hypothetical protein